MNLQDFAQFHVPALEADEIRFNVQIAVISAAVKEQRRDSPTGPWARLAIARSNRRDARFC
jgi:hypothetical protein